MVEGLRAEGFIKPGVDIDAEAFFAALAPFAEPAEHEEFHFSRDWMRSHFTRLSDPRNPDFSLGFKINLPPSTCSSTGCGSAASASSRRWTPPCRCAASSSAGSPPSPT